MGEPARRDRCMMGGNHPWLLVDSGELDGRSLVRLDSDEAAHLKGALRRRPGHRVVLSDGAGATANGVVATLSTSAAEVEILDLRRESPPAGAGVTVALALLHTRAMDWAVQKCVEIGVRRFVPMVCDRSQVSERAATKRSAHWERVARQACKQCHRPWFMELTAPTALAALVESVAGQKGVVADRRGLPVSAVPPEAAERLLVGPEGGFSDREERVLELAEWPLLKLGQYIMRAETAATIGAAFLVERSRE